MVERYRSILRRIEQAAIRAGRDPQRVLLLGAAKRQSARAVLELCRAGLGHVGENYVQEAEQKQSDLIKLLDGAAPPVWHLIGPLQSNKAGRAGEIFDWVHSIDRLRLARRLSAQAHGAGKVLHVLVQINTSDEASKNGVDPEGAAALCREISILPGLAIKGLMCLPRPGPDPESSRAEFRMLHDLQKSIRRSLGLEEFTELSMGMSDDLEVAIEEGSTIVRVGTALFGPRPG